jgi:DNA-binding transcriptional MocR family regulator
MISSKLSHITKTMKSSMIREMVASTRGIEGLISFAGGFPISQNLPSAPKSRATLRPNPRRNGSSVLQYGASEGYPCSSKNSEMGRL